MLRHAAEQQQREPSTCTSCSDCLISRAVGGFVLMGLLKRFAMLLLHQGTAASTVRHLLHAWCVTGFDTANACEIEGFTLLDCLH
jgi:hypothetical protein